MNHELRSSAVANLLAMAAWAILGLEAVNLAWVINHGAGYGRWLFNGAATGTIAYNAIVLLGARIKYWPY